MPHPGKSLLVHQCIQLTDADGFLYVAPCGEFCQYLRRCQEKYSSCLWIFGVGAGHVEIDVDEFFLWRVVGKLLHIAAHTFYLVELEPILKPSALYQPHRLVVHRPMGYRGLKRGVDALHEKREETAVARLVGEKLQFVA